MRLKFLVPAVLAVAVILTGCASTSHEVQVANAWVRASEYSDHVGGMTGIFADISNPTDRTITLVGGTTEIASMVETHEVQNGIMKMKHGGITINPGKTVHLVPGGLHVMLMDLKKPIRAGDKVTVTLDFVGADDVSLELSAKVAQAGDETYKK